MYDPFAHITGDPWWRLSRLIESDFHMCLGCMEEAMRDSALDDEWPEWAVA
jgi:hypothetical protein